MPQASVVKKHLGNALSSMPQLLVSPDVHRQFLQSLPTELLYNPHQEAPPKHVPS